MRIDRLPLTASYSVATRPNRSKLLWLSLLQKVTIDHYLCTILNMVIFVLNKVKYVISWMHLPVDSLKGPKFIRSTVNGQF